MTWREDIEAGRKKVRDKPGNIRIRTRTSQQRQSHNKFLLWIGENIERFIPHRKETLAGTKTYTGLIREDINAVFQKLRPKKKVGYDHLSAAHEQSKRGM